MKVVIVGGGFGGIKTALELSKDKSMHVTLISDKDHFLYYPALYETATGHSHLESVVSLDKIFKDTRLKVVIDTMDGIDTHRKMVNCVSGKSFEYDSLVIAIGVVTTYFGIEGLEKYSYSIKSYAEVQRFKKHLHDEVVSDKHLDKHYIVVGAGPTGVELSASLASYLEHIALKHHATRTKVHIDLVEAAPRILPRMSVKASQIVEKRLKHLGVKVMSGKAVQSEDDDSIIISGKDIPSKTVIWTSGVANHPFFMGHDDIFKLAPNKRVVVNDQLEAAPNIYVIGDNAATAYTGLAQTALHDAQFVAKVIKSEAHNQVVPSYKAVKPPVVIPVGEKWALFEWGPLRLSGRIASWIRRAADLIGYHDILPIGQALGVWRSERVNEHDCSICDTET